MISLISELAYDGISIFSLAINNFFFSLWEASLISPSLCPVPSLSLPLSFIPIYVWLLLMMVLMTIGARLARTAVYLWIRVPQSVPFLKSSLFLAKQADKRRFVT